MDNRLFNEAIDRLSGKKKLSEWGNAGDFEALGHPDGGWVLNLNADSHITNDLIHRMIDNGYINGYEPVPEFVVPARNKNEAVVVFKDFLMNYDQWNIASPDQAGELISAAIEKPLASWATKA